MNIGLFFNDKGFSDLDLSTPVLGNNGVGGTQYCFLMLADALAKYTDHNVIFYHYNKNILPQNVESHKIIAREEIITRAKEDSIDILIFKSEGINEFVKNLHKSDIHAIVWAHNYLYSEELQEYCENPNISRVVFVGHEMYDRYIDHPITKKATYIYNMFDGRAFTARQIPSSSSVTYTGSLIPAKGFLMLASVWKEIVQAVPDAQLYVIGNGKLYDRNAELGAYGIAEKSYENQFMPFLTQNGHIMDNVHFLGTMGMEKVGIYEKTTVGVMNPTGKTETFGLSAVEMAACGIPVVTKRANGLYDTVINGKTGYLIRNKKELARRIIELLNNKALNQRMGANGKKFADSVFLPESIVEEWNVLFDNVMACKNSQPIQPSKHYLNNLKWLRVINRKLQNTGIKMKPIIDVECAVRKVIRHKVRVR